MPAQPIGKAGDSPDSRSGGCPRCGAHLASCSTATVPGDQRIFLKCDRLYTQVLSSSWVTKSVDLPYHGLLVGAKTVVCSLRHFGLLPRRATPTLSPMNVDALHETSVCR